MIYGYEKEITCLYSIHAPARALIKNQLLDIVDTMVKADYEVTIYPTQCAGDAKEKVESVCRRIMILLCAAVEMVH